jgi:hypothetical protein
MTGWRDDLPPIPSERIRAEAMREGFRRREQRAKRQRAVLYGGLGTGAVALILLIASQSRTVPGDDDDAAAPAETAEATAEAAATTARTIAEATEAPATTEAAAATTAATEETAAPVTDAPSYTTVSGSIAALPVSGDVVVTPPVISEQPVSGNSECGPTTVDVEFRPQGVEVRSPVVHWEVAGARGEAPMEVDGDTATATVGPFPPDTLIPGARHEVLIYVIDPGVTDQEIYRAPLVVLTDCAP